MAYSGGRGRGTPRGGRGRGGGRSFVPYDTGPPETVVGELHKTDGGVHVP
jgi:hypothetical protein